ncbi:succinate dehydrogenase, cytochrome b556 subunit [Hirschia maritima]|uniref:succinate dehydrogenase, cytochrome b556 subunit n=1 Tax=Hirschia maritima TaxID=1121961 RepID=UPI00036C0ACD|nr:succinate dehydrogenase, cytochrome b556 subunit [Hirschia maritima]
MANQVEADKRPLSPHLQVWKFHPTMLTSIMQRITGVGNALGVAIVVGWLFAIASGGDIYRCYDVFFTSIFGKIILFGFTVSVMYHLAQGVRFLFWDMGKGFTPAVANFWSYFTIAFGVLGAVGVWFFAGLIPGVAV